MGSPRRRAVLARGSVVLAVAGLLSACTQQTPLPDATHAVLPISPATRQASPTSTPKATTNPTFLRDPEAAPWGVTLVPNETLVGHYTNYVYPVQVPRDGGPIRYARGTPITEGSKIVAYKVASGDIYDYIAKRFHLTNDGYLLILNEVRRGEAAQLYEGDVLNLSAYTLNKYGTVNGRVVKGPQSITAPPQTP